MPTHKKTQPITATAHTRPLFPIIGIGASAGGLAAFEAFFSGMPNDPKPNMAFVLIQHLSPDYCSILSELIQKHTLMPVHQVEDNMLVQPNCVYIIPPNHDMTLLKGALRLHSPTEPRGHRLPINYFFNSLALEQQEHSVGIILSGTGSDGTLGAKIIKLAQGTILVQTPESADFDGMPRSVIASGVASYILPPDKMPEQLLALTHTQHRPLNLPTLSTIDTLPEDSERFLQKIFALLKVQTRHDFSLYKRNTLYRRIQRRMATHQINMLELYLAFLILNPNEIDALFKDLLIGVTQFFRDAVAFEELEKLIIPKLFANKSSHETIRIWCSGCSTGEEAYSIAILIHEYMSQLKQNYKVQIFASDIDAQAITKARAGLYPASIANNITPERLARFFNLEGTDYRIHKSIRNMLVFSEHNIINDPPFSKVDLISCRNLLIYFNIELQKKLMLIFHYALNAEGILFLGNSESVCDFEDLFSRLNSKAKLYQRLNRQPSTLRKQALYHMLPKTHLDTIVSSAEHDHASSDHLTVSMRELTEKSLLQHFAPPSALITDQGEILYLHGPIQEYFESDVALNEANTNNILTKIRKELRTDLTASLQLAHKQQQPVTSPGLCLTSVKKEHLVNLIVRPIPMISDAPATALFLLSIEDLPYITSTPDTELTPKWLQLTQELHLKNKYIESFHKELESSTEELKCSNEEMQSINEELQATNEELETSKEELQSVNEELMTVNVELEAKLVELSCANNDMNNLLSGTGIATLFLDPQLCVMRFTPNTCKLINLIKTDIGRPISDLDLKLKDYDRLIEDCTEVLNMIEPKEIEVQTKTDQWYQMHIQPYRTLNNVIEGVVITFISTTESLKTQVALHRSDIIIRDSPNAIILQDVNGSVLAWNPAATRLYEWSEADALGKNNPDMIAHGYQEDYRQRIKVLCTQPPMTETFNSQRLTQAGAILDVSITASALVNKAGLVYAIATTESPLAISSPATFTQSQDL